jgi:cell division control protein 24
VLKGESMSSKNEEREYKIYLFEMILLCCKEINVNKPKNKMSTRTLVTKDGKPKLQLKGRIFMQNVTETISLQKPGMSPRTPCPTHADQCRLVYMSDLLER